MRISWRGLAFTACREALVLVAYEDGEHLSIGYGINDPNLKPRDTITPEKALADFRADMNRRGAEIGKHVNVHLCQHHVDAVLCAAFNLGVAGLCNLCIVDETGKLKPTAEPSPFILKLNAGDYLGAADELLPLLKNKEGRKREGLLKRRRLERALFLDADYGDISRIPFWTGNPNTTERQWMPFPAEGSF